MMDESKPWFLSKGFLGPAVTAILIALRYLGIVDLDENSTLEVVYHVAEFVGAALGAFGRATATKKLRVA
jgi:hypothetical protein